MFCLTSKAKRVNISETFFWAKRGRRPSGARNWVGKKKVNKKKIPRLVVLVILLLQPILFQVKLFTFLSKFLPPFSPFFNLQKLFLMFSTSIIYTKDIPRKPFLQKSFSEKKKKIKKNYSFFFFPEFFFFFRFFFSIFFFFNQTLLNTFFFLFYCNSSSPPPKKKKRSKKRFARHISNLRKKLQEQTKKRLCSLFFVFWGAGESVLILFLLLYGDGKNFRVGGG